MVTTCMYRSGSSSKSLGPAWFRLDGNGVDLILGRKLVRTGSAPVHCHSSLFGLGLLSFKSVLSFVQARSNRLDYGSPNTPENEVTRNGVYQSVLYVKEWETTNCKIIRSSLYVWCWDVFIKE